MEARYDAFDLALGESLARAALALGHFDAPLLMISIGASPQSHLPKSIRGLGLTSGVFRSKLRGIAARLKTSAAYLALVISFETAGSFEASKQNPVSHALGLLQFMPSTLDKMGVTYERARSMTNVEQLDLVEQYLRPWTGSIRSLASLYMAVLWPRLVGASENAVLFAQGSIEYAQNHGLDIDHDGRVQVREAVARVRQMRSGAPRLLVLGDSIAEGLEYPLRRLALDHGAEVAITSFVRGSTVKQWASRAAKAVDVAAPSTVLVCPGSNDAAAHKPPNDDDVGAVIAAAEQWGAETTWMGPFTTSDATAALDGAVWRARGAYVSGENVLARAKTRTAGDGVHLTPQGYAAAANVLWKDLGGTDDAPSVVLARQASTADDDDVQPHREAPAAFITAFGLSVIPLFFRSKRR